MSLSSFTHRVSLSSEKYLLLFVHRTKQKQTQKQEKMCWRFPSGKDKGTDAARKGAVCVTISPYVSWHRLSYAAAKRALYRTKMASALFLEGDSSLSHRAPFPATQKENLTGGAAGSQQWPDVSTLEDKKSPKDASSQTEQNTLRRNISWPHTHTSAGAPTTAPLLSGGRGELSSHSLSPICRVPHHDDDFDIW